MLAVSAHASVKRPAFLSAGFREKRWACPFSVGSEGIPRHYTSGMRRPWAQKCALQRPGDEACSDASRTPPPPLPDLHPRFPHPRFFQSLIVHAYRSGKPTTTVWLHTCPSVLPSPPWAVPGTGSSFFLFENKNTHCVSLRAAGRPVRALSLPVVLPRFYLARLLSCPNKGVAGHAYSPFVRTLRCLPYRDSRVGYGRKLILRDILRAIFAVHSA